MNMCTPRTQITSKRLRFFLLFVLDRVSLCRPGCPGAHSVDQVDLELRDSLASASRVLGLSVSNYLAPLEI